MIRKYKNFVYIVAILGFIIMSVGITYSYFMYEKEVVMADLSAGSIGINFVGEKKTITSNNISSSSDGQGKLSAGLDFSIEGVADTEEILYEVELVQTGLTSEQLDHVKIYLTDQNDSEVLGVYTYNELIDSKKNNGKMLNQRIIEGNPNGTSKTTTNNYRLRIWLDEESEGLITGNYQFDIYLYAVNIDKEDYHKLTFNSDDNRGTYTFKYVKSGDDYGDFPNITGVIKWMKGEDEVNDLTGFVGIEDITVVAEWPLTPLNVMKKNVITPTSPINFGEISSDTNGKGVYVLPGTESDEHPIYYYRGDVDNNNVIFGGFCWLIVRTTETGGTKMIYNGVVTGTTENPTCENAVGTARQLASTSEFNTSSSSMSDVGYMYNQRYAMSPGRPTSGAYFGTEIEYDDVNNVYNLKAGTTSKTLDATHHYTCNLTNASGTCSSIRYYYYNRGSSYYYITLTGGDFIEDALYKMTGNGSSETKTKNAGYILNTTSSPAKTNIENWFKTNLTNEEDPTKTNYQEYLEDTTWCNDRSYSIITGKGTYTEAGWNPSGGSLTTYQYFASGGRRYINNYYSTTSVPEMTCSNITDQFKVGNSDAKLNYPVGLLTTDEIIMAGASGNSGTSNSSYYLYSGSYNYWSLSPSDFNDNLVRGFSVYNGYIDSNSVGYAFGLRPAVSLKLGTEFVEGGEGTTTKPYVVKYTS